MYTKKEYLIHTLLFILTLIATTLAGGEWLYGKSILGESDNFLTKEYFIKSLHFSIPFIGILLFHEMGHLLTAIHYKVKSSLPYFIPAWLGFLGSPSIGTFGAIIQMKSYINSRKKFFDIGVAGPIAGFIIAIFVLVYGFINLPEADYIYEIHPEYLDPNFKHSEDDGYQNLEMGYNLLFFIFEKSLADPEKMPNMSEIIHYPYLFAGYLALFFTALNLLPISQLDGGHVVFGLFPRHHKWVSLATYIGFVSYAGLGLLSPFEPIETLMWTIPLYIGFLYICFRKAEISEQNKWVIVLLIASIQYLLVFLLPNIQGYSEWLFFAFLLGRVMGLSHPEVKGTKKLNGKRKIIGWIAIIIFILCFTPQPFIFE
ncbi:putative membrane-associated Zn-dependent protease [Belliella baltica DSM 15883]|uniref:Putative membrane-associated Zn-dependent protease n=1 Tax=Belliella baltica (strain DSM 15883 / CIP 108006 / LMG 21964 / BA134) TaxID=866536 RepID=I3Z9E9_BELBD|nr:site-2 protease family protein [Belliella baltica]AFL85867.1 putative membrane-associated Zn-dependent protease [Belliella baltica DSM 15883]